MHSQEILGPENLYVQVPVGGKVTKIQYKVDHCLPHPDGSALECPIAAPASCTADCPKPANVLDCLHISQAGKVS